MAQFIVVDFEFTYYNKPVGRPNGFFPEIIEVGAVKYDGKTNIAKLQSFVKPHFYPKQATAAMDFCMITQKDMEKGVEFCDMLKMLSAMYVPGETYFVTWGNDDYKVLSQGCYRHKLVNPIRKEDCLNLAIAYMAMTGMKRTPGLKATIETLGMTFDGIWHTAFDDALNTGKILHKMVDMGWDPQRYMEEKYRKIA
ncbi:3'-5' exonuclease [Anaerovibrio sp. RM50]|uniref:3'-5' exonuclease n=1 Tax=Anaerovibrio sp. RM50 TaxID=1200557 RepID=UPI00068745D3|nr:3'-5' exonuclease [Anaerovibrio sp. RM50]